jgi:ABC-2 type transport system permease protein
MAESPVALHRPSPWHSFRAGMWLGWQIESNWADPWVFTIYAVLRPVSLAGILVVMYAAITRGAFDSPVFTSMYLGNAFYIYVGAITSGMGWAVVQDREHYRTLKSIYAAPVMVPYYLIGRGVAGLVTASFSVIVILTLGVIVLGLGIGPATVEWPLFAAGLGFGVMALAFMGLAIAGIMLLTGSESWALGDLLAGALYLFSGAVFPLDVLPSALRPLGLVLPVTYWLEVIRRALIPGDRGASALAAWTDEGVLALLAALTATTAIGAMTLFRVCERRARQRGLIDRTSNY